MDFAGLNIIYTSLNTTQLADTRLISKTAPAYISGFDDHDHAVEAVPEPASWALLIIGFRLTGVAVRRCRHHATAIGAVRSAH